MTTIKVVENDDFPEESRGTDFVAFAMPDYKEDKRNLFVQLHSALDLFSATCSLLED